MTADEVATNSRVRRPSRMGIPRPV